MSNQQLATTASRCAATASLCLALTAVGGAPPGRYAVTADTVVDTKTALTWQRYVSGSRYLWASASSYCQSLSLGGPGWRLPSVKELQSLVDVREVAPSIDSNAFPITPPDQFWSSTPNAAGTKPPWVVDFWKGETSPAVAGQDYKVRCVR